MTRKGLRNIYIYIYIYIGQGNFKKELSRHDVSKNRYQYLTHKIKRVDKLINSKTADYKSQAFKKKIDRHGTISKQDF